MTHYAVRILHCVIAASHARGLTLAFFFSIVMSAMKMESAVTAPVSGHIKRVVVHEGEYICRMKASRTIVMNVCITGDSINQGDLVVEIVH